MTDLQKEFESTGHASWINADIYPDGKIYTQEYTKWLEKQVLALRQPPVKGSVCKGFFEYFGIILKFLSKELPIHIYAFYGDSYAMKVEFTFKGNKIVKVEYKGVDGFRHFTPEQMSDLKALIDKYQYEIANDWITFVIKNQRVPKRVITSKIKML